MSQFEGIENIVKELRNAINDWNRSYKRAKDLILDLARILNESGSVKTEEICTTIKNQLKKEIEKKMVTPKWIEEVLPDEYKRKYTKREVTSLSQPQRIEVTTTGEHIVHGLKESLVKELESDIVGGGELEDIQQVTTELKDDLPKPTSCDPELEDESIFVVSKEKLTEMVDCLKKCQKRCYLTFNVDGILTTIEPDL